MAADFGWLVLAALAAIMAVRLFIIAPYQVYHFIKYHSHELEKEVVKREWKCRRQQRPDSGEAESANSSQGNDWFRVAPTRGDGVDRRTNEGDRTHDKRCYCAAL